MSDKTAVEDATQGEVLVAVVAHSALEQAVVAYLEGVGRILTEIEKAADRLAEDGVSLAEFAGLLRGGDL